MIRQGSVSKKRAFTMEGDETESPTKRLSQESEDVLLKRLQDVVTERANHWLTMHMMHVSPISDELQQTNYNAACPFITKEQLIELSRVLNQWLMIDRLL